MDCSKDLARKFLRHWMLRSKEGWIFEQADRIAPQVGRLQGSVTIRSQTQNYTKKHHLDHSYIQYPK